jgi:excisionase family DNA binding protein
MTPDDLATYVGVPLATIRKWRLEKTGPRACRVGRHLRYRRADVEAWLEGRADKPNDSRAA